MRRTATITLSLVVAMSLSFSQNAAQAGQGGPVEPGPRDPDGTPKTISRLSQENLARLAEKRAMSDLFANLRAGRVDQASYDAALARFERRFGVSPLKDAPSGGPKSAAPESTGRAGLARPLAYPTAKYLSALTQVPQATDFYCGPAAAYEALAAMGYWRSYHGESLSQRELARHHPGTLRGKYLETDFWGGTPWSTCETCRPMPESLNMWREGNYYGYYLAVGLPDPTIDPTKYANDLVFDIYYGYPVLLDAWERSGGAHLVGHPVTVEITHWVAAYGYSNSGWTTHYADSVAGTNFWSWAGNVPRYSLYNSTTLVNGMLNGRGYVW